MNTLPDETNIPSTALRLYRMITKTPRDKWTPEYYAITDGFAVNMLLADLTTDCVNADIDPSVADLTRAAIRLARANDYNVATIPTLTNALELLCDMH